MRPADQARVESAARLFLEFGWEEAGKTPVVPLRVPGRNAPILNWGKSGGRLVMSGGRIRFRAPKKLHNGWLSATVGPRTTCFYRCAQGGPTDFEQFRTSDLASIRARLESVA